VGTQRTLSLLLLGLQASLAVALALLLRAEQSRYAFSALLLALPSMVIVVVSRRRPAHEAATPLVPNRSEPLNAAPPPDLGLERMERLAGGVARSFDDLLTTIGASTWMAEHALAADRSPRAELEEVRAAIQRASELTKKLAAMARRQPQAKRGLDLNELIGGMERPLGARLDHGTKLALALTPEPLPLFGDAQQLEQVILNLLLNAQDAIEPGGEIEIATSRQGDSACVEVRDNGRGLSDEARAHLFEPFFTTKPAGRAAGLGLAMCFGIVAQHEGRMQVDSAGGRGTVVRVELPLAPGAEPGVTTSGVVAIAHRPRVLVAEDEPQVRAVAVRALSAAGFEVFQVANGALGLAAIKSQQVPFDVLLTDVLMPKLSGPELARTARSIDPSVGVVFMSGYPDSMLGARVNEFAGAAFLAKPFTAHELIQAVRERAERRRAERRDHG